MMKANKKVVLSTAAVLGVAALVAGGTIAYFTDKDEETNTFTVGSVDVELYESQLHRMNSGRKGSFDALASNPNYCTYTGTGIDSNTKAGPQPGADAYNSAKYCTPGMNAENTDGLSAITNGHIKHSSRTWGFSDATIEADAAIYKSNDGYFNAVAQDIVPGQWIRKFAYAKNEGVSDAYVLIRYMLPKAYANQLHLEIPSTPFTEDAHATDDVDGVQPYFTMVAKNSDNKYEPALGDSFTSSQLKDYGGYEEGDYIVFAAVTNDPVAAGEMTFWSPVNTIKIEESATSADFANMAATRAFDVKVDAQAVQAAGFADAISAINGGSLE